MKKSTKAVLLSVFVFPGAGHLYLKKYFAAALLAGTSLTAIYYLTSNAVESAFEISRKIQSGAQLDIAAITQLVSQQSGSTEHQLLNIATTAFTICWLIGVIDAYRVGCIQDKNDNLFTNR